MRTIRKRITALVLAIVTLFLVSVPVYAAREEEFISEVALVYENSVEEARNAIAGTDWKLLEYDLNANADLMLNDGVYLIYKTSTYVEDAITDLRVMDMYGGYSTTNYEQQIEESRAEYTAMLNDLRAAATEFKALYEAGDEMALLAYRQMNYYEDVKTTGGTETGMLMGDFMLALSTLDDKVVVQVLFEGNSTVVGNLVSLLAIGISGEDDEDTLASRIAEQYSNKDELSDEVYYDYAVVLEKTFESIRAKLLRYDALSEEYSLEDENMTEEEFVFMTEYASLALYLDEIRFIDESNDFSLAELLREDEYTTRDFYPIAAALTDGQKALIKMGQLENVLKYNAPSKPIAELNEFLNVVEEDLKDENGNLKPIDVYFGVDRSIFKGTLAFTDKANRQQALTGESWDVSKAFTDTKALDIVSYVVAGLSGVALGVTIFSYAANAYYKSLEAAAIKQGLTGGLYAANAFEYLNLATTYTGVTLALIIIAAGIKGIATAYNYYNPSYLDIPNTIIDVCETDLGDKYVKYAAAKVFDDGKLSEKKNADFNAYEGKEWIALYYTKDASAGNCLLANFSFSDSSNTIARRYQGISMFGETNAFNLNTHVYNSAAKGAYITMRYSNTKKAAADIPAVVGSIFGAGTLYALTALGGAGVGTAAMALINTTKTKKRGKDEAEESES